MYLNTMYLNTAQLWPAVICSTIDHTMSSKGTEKNDNFKLNLWMRIGHSLRYGARQLLRQ